MNRAQLEEGILFLFDAISRGDRTAGDFGIDILQKWPSAYVLRRHTEYFHFEKSNQVTVSLLDGSPAQGHAAIKPEPWIHAERHLSAELYVAALHNLWTDEALVTAYCLALWGKECPCETSLPARLFKALMNGTSLVHGGGDIKRPADGANAAMEAILRQHFSRDEKYRGLLDRLVARIQDIVQPEMIPGRIYSGWGGKDLDDTLDGQLAVMCFFARDAWDPQRPLGSEIQELIGRDPESARGLRGYLEQALQRLAAEDFAQLAPFIECASGAEGGFARAREHVVAGLTSLLQLFDEEHRAELLRKPVSQDRVAQLTRWAAEKAFAPATAAFPIPLFSDIALTDDHLEVFTLKWDNRDKGEFVEPPMALRASNEDEYLSDAVRSNVAAVIMNDALRAAERITRAAADPDEYWRELQAAAQVLTGRGARPILLIENRTVPRWIWDWGTPRPGGDNRRPDGLAVSVRPAQRSGYVCHFNDIAVYVAPIQSGASVVVAAEAFEQLRFTRFGSGAPVEVNIIEVENDRTKVNMHVRWARQVRTAALPVFRIEYGRA